VVHDPGLLGAAKHAVALPGARGSEDSGEKRGEAGVAIGAGGDRLERRVGGEERGHVARRGERGRGCGRVCWC
jgi:hypothetical protein